MLPGVILVDLGVHFGVIFQAPGEEFGDKLAHLVLKRFGVTSGNPGEAFWGHFETLLIMCGPFFMILKLAGTNSGPSF